MKLEIMLERTLFISTNLKHFVGLSSVFEKRMYACIIFPSSLPSHTRPPSSSPIPSTTSTLNFMCSFFFFLTHWVHSVLPVSSWVGAHLLEHFAKSWSCCFHWYIDHQKMWSQPLQCVWHRKKKRWKDFLSSLLPILKMSYCDEI